MRIQIRTPASYINVAPDLDPGFAITREEKFKKLSLSFTNLNLRSGL
jgi:hypothetical protein